MKIHLEYQDAKSHKFWEGVATGSTLVTRWGRVGTEGQSKSFDLASRAAAEAELSKKAKAKMKKGYAEVASSTNSKPTPRAKTSTKLPAKKADKRGSPSASPPFPTLDPDELTSDTIRLSDYPGVFAFSPDGTTLAAHGISSVHLVDVPSRAWSTTHKSKEARTVLFHDEGLLVGSKTINLVDRARGKRVRAFKGHKAPANALALSADGATLWSGGGSFCNTHDRFLYAYDTATGELRYKVKPGKRAGAMAIAVLDDRVAVAAEDGHVRTFDAADGKPMAEVELAAPHEYDTPLGGVAASGDGFVASTVADEMGTVTWLSRDLVIEARSPIPLKDVDPEERLLVGCPLVAAGHVAVPVSYCVKGVPRVVVAVIDEATRELVGLRAPAELDDKTGCALSPDGTLAWKARGGVALAALVARKGGAAAKPKKVPPKKKPGAKVLASAAPAAAAAITTVGAMAGGGPRRQAAFEGSFDKAPTVLWARVEHRSDADEFGGSVVASDGIAVGSNGGWVCALDAKTGKTRWSVETATSQSWATGGISIAHGSVFIATNHGLYAYDAKTGAEQWRARVPGAAGAPLVFDDICLVGGNKGLHARSLGKKGRKAWSFPVKDRITTAPAYADGFLYAYADTQLLAIDLSTRQLAWSALASEPLRAGPLLAAELVLYMAGPGTLAAADRRTGKQVWTTDVDVLVGCRPWAASGEAVILRDDDGRIQAYDLSTGKACWTSKAKRKVPDGIGSAGPIVVGKSVIAVTVEEGTEISGRTHLTALNAKNGRVRWDLDATLPHRAIAKEQKKVGSGADADWNWDCTPHVHDGVLFAQTDAGVVALR